MAARFDLSDKIRAIALRAAREACIYDEITHRRYESLPAACPRCQRNYAIIAEAIGAALLSTRAAKGEPRG